MFVLTRADAGRYPLQKRALYLNDLLEEIARAGGVLASDKDVTLEVTNLEDAAFQETKTCYVKWFSISSIMPLSSLLQVASSN